MTEETHADAGPGFMKKLHTLPGARVSPEVLLHRTLEKVSRMKAVVVVIVWDDGSFGVDYCSMKNTELTTAARVLGIHADRELLAAETYQDT